MVCVRNLGYFPSQRNPIAAGQINRKDAKDAKELKKLKSRDLELSTAPSQEACREELAEVLEEWILFRVSKGLTLPAINGIELDIKEMV